MGYEKLRFRHKAVTITAASEMFGLALDRELIPYLNDGWDVLIQTPVTQTEKEFRRGGKFTEFCVTFVLRKAVTS